MPGRSSGHISRSLPEEMRIYSKTTNIYIKEPKKNENSKTARKFDCVHACCICSKKIYTNLLANLDTHVSEPEIKKSESSRESSSLD